VTLQDINHCNIDDRLETDGPFCAAPDEFWNRWSAYGCSSVM